MAKRSHLEVDGIPIKVRYADVRNLRISVRPPNGEVRVSAPTRATEAQVLNFIDARLGWLHSNRAKLTQPPEDGVRAWGELLPLRIDLQPGKPGLEQDASGVSVTAQSASDADAEILRWRKRLLAEAIPPMIAAWAPILGVTAGQLTFRKISTRWGTCNHRTGRLTFNTELSTKPKPLVEYVVVHELTHLRVPNHGPAFQASMTAHLPDWRALRRALNGR